MANNNSLRSVIESNNDCVKFAKHFQKKSSIKNMLKSFGNAKTIEVAFDEKYATEIIGYGKVRENLEIVLMDVFREYIKKYTNDKLHGNTQSLPDRVEFLLGLVDERMKRDPGTPVVRDLGDYSKTKTGKELEEIVKSVGGDNDKLMDLLLLVAVRSTINDAISDECDTAPTIEVDIEETVNDTSNELIHSDSNPIDVDFVIVGDYEPIEVNSTIKRPEPEHRSHTRVNRSSKMHSLINVPIGRKSSKTSDIMNDFYEAFEKLSGLSDHEIKNALRSLRIHIKNNWDDVVNDINNVSVDDVDTDDIMSVLPDRIDYSKLRGISIEKLLKGIRVNYGGNDECHKQTVLNIYMATNLIECIVELDNENEFTKYMFNIVDTVCKLMNNDEYGFINNMKKTRSIINDVENKIENKRPLSMKESLSYMGNYGLIPNRIKVKDSLNYIESIA